MSDISKLKPNGSSGSEYDIKDSIAREALSNLGTASTKDAGVASGVAELDANGKVPSSQLPSYVDDVLEYASESAFPATGETGKIYVALDTNLTYRWSGSAYVEISPSLALGETDSTAYRGDRGKTAYDHSQSDHSDIKPAFSESSTRANIASGESIATIFGKIKKYFSDLKDLAFVAKDGTSSKKFLQGDATWQSHDDVTHTFSQASTRTNLASGEKISVSLGKIMKWFADLKDLAFIAKDGTSSTKYLRGDGTWQAFPSIPAAQVNSDWNATSGVAEILNKPTLGTASAKNINNTYNSSSEDVATGKTIADAIDVESLSDETPYLYRQSPAIGTRMMENALVGGSFVVNQLCQSNLATTTLNNVTITKNSDNTYTLSGQANADGYFVIDTISVLSGRKYLVRGCPSGGSASTYYLGLGGTNNDTGNGGINNNTSYTGYTQVRFVFKNGANFGSGVKLKPNIIDLDIWFGSDSIPNNAYTKEQSTAGSGIAFLKSYGFFTEDYYPYNAGTLVSVNPSGKKVVGKNLVEETIHATIDANGLIATSSSFDIHIAKVIEGKTYTVKSDESASASQQFVGGFFYDKPQIGSTSYNNARNANTPATFVAPITGYVAFRTSYGYTTPQIEFGSQSTAFSEYESKTYNFSATELRGIPKLVNNALTYDGDVRESDGTLTRKYGIVDLGSLDYTKMNEGLWYCSDGITIGSVVGLLCSIYATQIVNSWGQLNNKCIARHPTAQYVFTIRDDSYTDATTFKTAMSGVYLIYELATPTTESVAPFDNPQISAVGGTEEFIDTRDYPVPIGHQSVYKKLPEMFGDEYFDETLSTVDSISNYINGKGYTQYGFYIDGTKSDPSDMVTYLCDAMGMTPAKMNYTTGKFEYGSWEDAFFMPKPCILAQSGYVMKYLDPNDFSKDVDGNTVAIDGGLTNANVMIEFPKIWYKVDPSEDAKSAAVYIASEKIDDGYKDYAYIDYQGVHKKHFYMPAYNGSLVNDTMRSISGQAVMKTKTAQQEVTYAQANGDGWYTEDMGEIMLINFLLILMGKSTDTQTVFGQGLHTNGTEAINDGFRTGVHNTKGMFYGTNSGTIASGSYGNAVKVFGIENYWGFQWRRYAGDMLVNGVRKIKLCYGTEDGSSASTYNFDGTGYVDVGATPSGTSGGYISEMKFTASGMYSKVSSGSASTYYCDGQWFNNSATCYALRGGPSDDGAPVGAFCVALSNAAAAAGWARGAAPSYK